jgi:hypothetical protein
MGFKEQLREQLVDAAARQAHGRSVRRQRQRVLMVAAAVVFTVVGVAAISRPDTASAGVEILVVDGRLQVKLTDVETRADFVEKQIAKAGLDVTVSAAPVGPSAVGRFVGSTGGAPAALRELDAHGDQTFVGFSVPVDWKGHLDLAIGRPARTGEAYATFSDAYGAGEPLSCSGAWGATATAILPTIDERGLHASFVPYIDGKAQARVEAADIATSAQRDWRITEAVAVAPDTVFLTITSDGNPPVDAPLNRDRGACHE